MTKLRHFDQGQSLTSTLNATSTAIGAAAGAYNTANRFIGAASALPSITSAGGFASAARLASSGLSAGAEAVGDIMGAVSMFGSSDADENDWRVRLSLPRWTSFQSSPVLKPLKNAGGLIFPYTPQVTMKPAAKYSPESVTHSNYPFHVYKNSDPGQIEISAPMNVEDPEQALYWIAAVHYLRSVSKMFTGFDPKAGNPPPVVFLNGYGNFVFKNVPVVITSFSLTLPKDCDYISTEVVGSAAGDVAGIADSVGDLADTVGGAFGDAFGGAIGDIAGVVSEAAGFVGQAAGILGSFGVGGATSGGYAYIPTKSEISVTLSPVYSRNSARKFSLDRFVSGGYLNSTFGYI